MLSDKVRGEIPRATGAVRKKKRLGMFFFCMCFRARVFGSCLGSCGATFGLKICATAYSWNLHACVFLLGLDASGLNLVCKETLQQAPS